MPALPTATTDYLTAIKAALRAGSDLNPPTSTITAPGRNYLAAMDMANVLEMLQEALSDGATLEATGGSTTTLTDTGAYTANAEIGNLVTFAGDITAPLAGITARVISNDANTLTFDRTLPGAVATGDDYVITVDTVDAAILNLRDGSTARSSVPRGDIYGTSRVVTGALLALAEKYGVTVASYQPTVNGGTLGTSTTTEAVLDLRGATVPVDFFVGMFLRRSGQSDRKIVSSNETGTVTVVPAYSGAASGAYTVVRPLDGLAPGLRSKDTHPGAQAGGNDRLAEFIELVQAAVVAHTIPA